MWKKNEKLLKSANFTLLNFRNVKKIHKPTFYST